MADVHHGLQNCRKITC